MTDFKLYCFAQSGNAYKAALMLALCDLDWEPAFVDYFGGETRSDGFRAINELGEVPVLVHGGRTLSQSGVILDYLTGETGRFGASSPEEGREILRWLFWDNHKLTSYTATYRFLHTFTEGVAEQVADFLEKRMRGALGILDRHLDGRTWVVGGDPTIADLSICGYLFFSEEFGVDWAGEYPNVGIWLGRIAGLKGWEHPYDLMPGHPLVGQS